MKRELALIVPALILIALIMPRCYGQDIRFTATNPFAPGVGNLGVTGASIKTNFLNTSINDAEKAAANGLAGFNVVDVATGDFNGDNVLDIAAISFDDSDGNGINDQGNLVVFFGIGDGT